MLSREEIESESKRIIEELSWALTEEAIDDHFINKNTSSKYGIVAAILNHAVSDAIDVNEINPAYLIGYLALRVWGQNPELREDLSKIFNFDALDNVKSTI